MSLNWNDLHDEAYFHFLNFNPGVAEKFNNLCEESVEFIFDNLTEEERIGVLKQYIFKEIREQSSPKELFLLLEDSNKNDLIQKHNLTPEDFIQKNFKYKNWVLNKKTGHYDPPIPEPSDGKKYKWNEVDACWVEIGEWKWEELSNQSEDRKLTYNEKRKERLKICSECEYNNNNLCNKCGCIIPLKTAAPWMSCPVNKWESMWDDDK